MKWFQLIQAILSLSNEELPVVLGIVATAHNANPALPNVQVVQTGTVKPNVPTT